MHSSNEVKLYMILNFTKDKKVKYDHKTASSTKKPNKQQRKNKPKTQSNVFLWVSII